MAVPASAIPGPVLVPVGPDPTPAVGSVVPINEIVPGETIVPAPRIARGIVVTPPPIDIGGIGIQLPPINIGGGGGGTGLTADAFCPPPARIDPVTGVCGFFLGSQAGPDPQFNGGGGGGAVGGRLHTGDHAPQVVAVTTRRCLRGSVLGIDGICHSKREIRNSDRMYPKARRPLGTSGDMSAVRKAGVFANRLKRTEKTLNKVGRALGKKCPSR